MSPIWKAGSLACLSCCFFCFCWAFSNYTDVPFCVMLLCIKVRHCVQSSAYKSVSVINATMSCKVMKLDDYATEMSEHMATAWDCASEHITHSGTSLYMEHYRQWHIFIHRTLQTVVHLYYTKHYSQ